MSTFYLSFGAPIAKVHLRGKNFNHQILITHVANIFNQKVKVDFMVRLDSKAQPSATLELNYEIFDLECNVIP